MDGDGATAEAVIARTEALDATLSMAGQGIPLYKRAILRCSRGACPSSNPS